MAELALDAAAVREDSVQTAKDLNHLKVLPHLTGPR